MSNSLSKRQSKQKKSMAAFYRSMNDYIINENEVSLPLAPVKVYPIGGVKVEFPFQPYPSQLQMMAKIIRSLKRRENALLESPTGKEEEKIEEKKIISFRCRQSSNTIFHGPLFTHVSGSGKSLAILCSALAWMEHEKTSKLEENKKKLQKIQEVSNQLWENPLKRSYKEMNSISTNQERKNVETLEDDDFQPVKVQRTGKMTRLLKLAGVETEQQPISLPLPNCEDPTKHCDIEKTDTGLSRYTPCKIYVGSRTHRQLAQLISELKGNTCYRPKMTVLGSRDQMCIEKRVSKSSTKNDDCKALMETSSCIPGVNSVKLVRHSSIQKDGSKEIWDIEDLVRIGKQIGACPYYAARTIAEEAEIIFCPYNYIIDPNIRKSMGITLQDNVVILDEAHNIEDVARTSGSFEATETEWNIIHIELTQVIRNFRLHIEHGVILSIVDSFLSWMRDSEKELNSKEHGPDIHLLSGPEIISELKKLQITESSFSSSITPAFSKVVQYTENVRKEKEKEKKSKPNDQASSESQEKEANSTFSLRASISTSSLRLLESFFMVIGFFYEPEHTYADDYRMVLIRNTSHDSTHGNDWKYKMGFWCLNPGIIFKQISEHAHSVILTSGTLSPLSIFASELEAPFANKLEATHVVDKSQLWVRVIPYGPRGSPLKGVYTTVQTPQYQDDVGEALCNIIETVPFGVLVFLSSYSLLKQLQTSWENSGILSRIKKRKKIFCEPSGSSKLVFEKSLNKYYEYINDIEETGPKKGIDGAIFFAVFRGKVSEGIDFKDNHCRAVISLGIPFPSVKEVQISLKKKYNDIKKSTGNDVFSGAKWYSTQAYRAINQALGRCIRHRNDWGAIILLEERFCEESHQSGLSKWVEKVCAIETRGFETTMHSLDQFVKERVEIDRNRKKEKKTPSPILPIHAPPEIESLILPAKLSPVLPEKSLLNTNVTLINTKPLVPQEALQNEQNMLHLPIKETGTKIKPIEIEDSPLTDNLTLPETTSLIFDSDDTPSLIDSDTGQFFAEALSAKIEPDTKEYFGIDPLENRDTSSLIVSKSNDVIEKKDREPWVEGSLVDTNHSSINESMYLPSTLSRNCKQYDLSPSVYTNIVKQDTHQAIVYDHQERNPPTFTTPKTLIQSVSSSSDSLNIHSTLTSQPQLQPLLSSDPAFLFNSEQHSISCRWHDRILFSNVKDVYEVRTRVTQLEYFLSMDFCLSMKNTHRKSSCYVFELNFPTTWTHGSIKETLFNANEKEDECLVDGLLYRKFRSKCCDKAIGAMIIDALDNSLHSHKQLVGKLWFLRNAVFFKGFVP